MTRSSDGNDDDDDVLDSDGDPVVGGSDGSDADDDDRDRVSDSGENTDPINLSLDRAEDVFGKYTPASGLP